MTCVFKLTLVGTKSCIPLTAGQQYLLTGNKTAADILVATSHALAQRFVPAVHAFESWGPLHPSNGQIEVIVDNMLNLQLMFFAGTYSNNQTLTDMAVSHAGLLVTV